MRIGSLAAALILAPAAAMAADCNRPAPIALAPGASSATIASGEPTGTSDCYQVAVRGDQVLTVSLDSETGDAAFALYAPGWTAKCDPAGDCEVAGDILSDDETRSWSDAVQGGGAYLIVVDNAKSDSDYRLTVKIE